MNKPNTVGVSLALFLLLFHARAPAAYYLSANSGTFQSSSHASDHVGRKQDLSLQPSFACEKRNQLDIIPNPYEEAMKTMKAEDRRKKNLDSCLSLDCPFSASLVSQAAEQGAGAQLQKCGKVIINAHLGSVDIGCSHGICHCCARSEPEGDLFRGIVLLLMSWISEIVAGRFLEIVYSFHVLSFTHMLWALCHWRKY